MSDLFDNITTRMDIRKSSVDTTYDKSRFSSRAIKKVPYTFTVPSQIIAMTGFNVLGCLVAQVNYQADTEFRILRIENLNDIALGGPVPTYGMYIRFRVGGTTYRYRLAPIILDSGIDSIYNATGYSVVQALQYTNQRISPNFVIEWWRVYAAGVFLRAPSHKITTSKLQLPESASTIEEVLDSSVSLARTDLALAMPETLPTTYGDNSNWLTN